MPAPDALDAALALFKDPVKARSLPGRPLPPDMAGLLAIAVGNEEALAAASRRSGFARQPLQDAAGFFIEQALFCRDADSYRVLGGGPHSTHEELRHNMALLMRWLHPDLQSLRKGPLDREVFASRVSRAWEDLKTAERREAYDLRRTPEASRSGAARGATDTPPGSARERTGTRPAGGGSGNGKTRSGRAGAAPTGAGRPDSGKAGTRPARNGKAPGQGGRSAGAVASLPHRPRTLSVHKIEEASLWVRLWGLLWGRR